MHLVIRTLSSGKQVLMERSLHEQISQKFEHAQGLNF